LDIELRKLLSPRAKEKIGRTLVPGKKSKMNNWKQEIMSSIFTTIYDVDEQG